MNDALANSIASNVEPAYITDIRRMNTHDLVMIREKRKRDTDHTKRRGKKQSPRSEDPITSVRHIIRNGASMVVESRGTGFHSK